LLQNRQKRQEFVPKNSKITPEITKELAPKNIAPKNIRITPEITKELAQKCQELASKPQKS